MAEETNISWCDRTWSPWYGCTQVSMGDHGACEGCYARFLSETRMGRVVFGGPGRGLGTRDGRAESAWKDPVRWNRQGPAFVFPSMCDPFDNHPALTDLRRRFFELIVATPHLTWLLLTKRPQNIIKLFAETVALEAPGGDALHYFWPRNAAIGCTVVTQAEADRDIPQLLAAKATLNPAFAFVSMEPLLEPVDMRRWLPQGRLARRAGSGEEFYAPHFYMTKCEHCGWVGSSELCGADSFGDDSDVYCAACSRSIRCDDFPTLDWVIAGGETDQGAHRARPSHPQWFRSLRDQCAAASVPFHFKQNGEWQGYGAAAPADADGNLGLPCEPRGDFTFPDGETVFRVGKKAAGRLLDGALHDARPEVRPC